MDFKIVCGDISEIEADAIVLPANRKLCEGRGVSSVIFEKAGRKQLRDACRQIYDKYKKRQNDIKIGTAVATLAFNLQADYIIHAIVPRWIDGHHNEFGLLRSAYLNSLDLADALGSKTIAFPLLSSGNNGFDIEDAFCIAKSSIKDFEPKKELDSVYLVVYGSGVLNLLNRYGFDIEVARRETSVDIRNASEKNIRESTLGLEPERDSKAQKTGLEDAALYPENEMNRVNLVDTGKDVDSNAEREILTMSFKKNGILKKIHLISGNICDIEEPVDVVVCSAWKGGYKPSSRTLIGALYNEKGIDVRALSEHPELDLRSTGCWLSEKTGSNFSRIACVELLTWKERLDDEKTDKVIWSAFSTLKFLCEQAAYRGILIRNIVMPILGTGKQKIDINYIAPVLFSQMKNALESVEELTDIFIYDRDPDKIKKFSEILSRIYNKSGTQAPDVFISYSSKQTDLAHRIFKILTSRGVSCWIAPESISPGSDYVNDIAIGLGITKLTVLVLTQDAEKSRWVQKEIKATISSKHILIPFQKEPYDISYTFNFMLQGEQILEAWKQSGDVMEILADAVMNKLKGKS